ASPCSGRACLGAGALPLAAPSSAGRLSASGAHGGPPAADLRAAAPNARDLPRPDAIPGAFTVRQRLTARSARGGGGFEVVLQKKPGELLLVGLTPFGSRAFVLRQTDRAVELTSYMPRELPFAPAYALLDVHRVLDAWLGPPPPDGPRAGDRGGERIRELWRGGRLVERTFTRLPGPRGAEPPGDVTISYEGDGPA